MKSKYANNRTAEEIRDFWFNSSGERRCCTCEEYKPLVDFHKDKNGRGGAAYSCKTCAIARSKHHHHRRMKDDPSYAAAKRVSYIKHRWKMTPEQYENKLAAQKHTCPICHTTEPVGGWHLDHNHSTGAIRDFLCGSCNRGIGYLYENTKSLMNAIKYLERHNENAAPESEGRSL